MPTGKSDALAPLHEADLSRVEAVFTDVDGTLTTNGKLTSATLRAIEWLQSHRVPVVLVSFGYTVIPAVDLGADAVIDDFAELIKVLARFA